MIDRDVEEALDLLAVKIHGKHAVGARRDKQVRHEFRGNGHARLVLAILARIAVERHDRGDALGRRPAGGIDHDKQLHQVMVRRRTRRLDDEDIRAADVLVDLHERLAIREAGHRRLPERHADVPADFLCQGPVRVSREYFQPNFAHKVAAILPRSGGGGSQFSGFSPGESFHLFLQRLHAMKKPGQALLEHGNPAFQHQGDCGVSVY